MLTIHSSLEQAQLPFPFSALSPGLRPINPTISEDPVSRRCSDPVMGTRQSCGCAKGALLPSLASAPQQGPITTGHLPDSPLSPCQPCTLLSYQNNLRALWERKLPTKQTVSSALGPGTQAQGRLHQVTFIPGDSRPEISSSVLQGGGLKCQDPTCLKG